MASKRVAVVTGGNKGIGLAVVKTLCQQNPDWIVYLTARDVGRGQAAVDALKKEGVSPSFHQLDINSADSIAALRGYLEKTYGGLNVLVNNAAIAYKASSTASFAEQAEVSMATNYTAMLNVCDSLFPLLRPHARVVNVSSFVSQMALSKMSAELKKKFTSKLTMDQLSALMKDFVELAKVGKHTENGWPDWAYGVTKVGVTCMTIIQQEALDKDSRDIIVNAVDPGWVQTDMTGNKGKKTPAEGADSIVYCATLPPNTKEPRGKLVSDRKVQPWQ